MFWIKKCLLENYANFNGRARRKELWSFYLGCIILSAALGILTGIFNSGIILMLFGIIGALAGLAILIPGIAVSIRRLHDTGRSGYWILINFVPAVGSIIMLVFLLTDSQPGTNQYGPCPKEEYTNQVG